MTWARERAGYDVDELQEGYAHWESGHSAPTYLELEALADRFEVPTAVFFFPEPPESSELNLEFRALGPGAFQTLSPRMRFLMEKALYRSRNLQSLYAIGNAPKRLIVHDLRISVDDSPEALARQVRDYLDISVEKQFEWSSRGTSAEEWRAALAKVGIMVTVLDFRHDEYRSFALYDPRFPLICVCRSEGFWSGGVVTTCHSLIHLLFHTCGLDSRDDAFLEGLDAESRQIELLCNHASAEIVAPRLELKKVLTGQVGSREIADITSKLAHLFGVTGKWMNNRLLKLNLVTENEHEETLMSWERRPVGGGGGLPPPPDMSLIELGEPFVRLAFECFDSGQLDEDSLADYLELAPQYFDDLRDLLGR
ncbi:MAG: XRE family transcriptional regulator [Chloroflexi bacterium]|nr:XRE family transcriptional regulator [Chloroflexota bacterium]